MLMVSSKNLQHIDTPEFDSIGHQPLWGCCPKVISFVSTTALVVLVWSNTGLKWPFVNHLHYQWFLNEVCALFFFCKIKTLTKR